MRVIRWALIAVFVLRLAAPALSLAERGEKKLSPSYRHWLDVEVPYIITSDERKEFLTLESDTERDTFITAFWKVRNPNPDSDTNSFKEEHYRRLAYANEHFGVAQYENGWRTDMGKMYIVLGPPQQRAPYHELANIRPMEIWFYQTQTPVLPPFFYLLFYKPSASEPYKLYSPRNDGPVKLMTTGESRNDPVRALGILKKFAGDEVARTAVSLLPSEHVNLDEFAPSPESEALIQKVQDLQDNPFTKELLAARRMREQVTTSILTGDTAPEMSYAVFRDAAGASTVSYLVKNRLGDPRLIEEGADKALHYDLTLKSTVLTADGKFVYEQDDALTGKVTETQAVAARQKRFGAEARLPLAPGKYVVVATLTNNLNHLATRQHVAVTVPEAKAGTIGISPLVAYTAPAPVPDAHGILPFSASRYRFTPRGAETVEIRQGEKLALVFQLWLGPKANEGAQPGTKVHVRYVFGAEAAGRAAATTENEEVNAADRDAAGNLLTGHTLDTSTLEPGTYRVVVGANWDDAPQTSYQTLTLHVRSSQERLEVWTAYGGVAADVDAVDDLKRGMSAEALGEDGAAEAFYDKVLKEGPGEVRALERLADLATRRKETETLAALGTKPMLADDAVPQQTLLAISAAMRASGNAKGAAKMLEAQLKLQAPTAALYTELAEASEAAGDTRRAKEARGLAAGLK